MSKVCRLKVLAGAADSCPKAGRRYDERWLAWFWND
jgi:hypothetical protein